MGRLGQDIGEIIPGIFPRLLLLLRHRRYCRAFFNVDVVRCCGGVVGLACVLDRRQRGEEVGG